MTGPQDQDRGNVGPGRELFVPYVPARPDADADADADGGAGARVAPEVDWHSGARVRPAPAGMGRRDRRAWRDLEVARVARVRIDAHRGDSARGGFIASPPRFADRRTRKAWLAGEREGSRQWWERRRRSDTDMQARQRGALVAALLVAGVCAWWVISGVHHSHGSATTTAGTAGAEVTTTPPIAVVAAAAAAAPPVPVVAGGSAQAAPTTSYPIRTVGPAGEPGRNGTLDHGWVPVPTGGVAPVAPDAAPTPINPATVKIIPPPTVAAAAADRKSPTAAMKAWAVRMCPSSWRQTYGADQESVKALMTAAAWKTFDPAADTIGAGVFGGVVSLRQVRRCGQVSVQASADQPISSGIAYVHYQGLRVVTSDLPGMAPVVEPMAGQRVVVQQRDGSWLVDVDTIGG